MGGQVNGDTWLAGEVGDRHVAVDRSRKLVPLKTSTLGHYICIRPFHCATGH